jgi:glycosyltransferase involved in cell wall biosynthesis
MRIGVMLRTLDEHGGIAVYSKNLVRELLDIDRENQYVLFYRSAAHIGTFGSRDNVSERLVRGPNKAFWDQVSIPYACWREGLDLVLHPKFTVPLLAPCKAVMVVHGADWFMPEQARFYNWLDVRYIRAVMPLYFRKAAAVISVSELTTQNFNHVLNLPPTKVRTIYFGPAKFFARVSDKDRLGEVRERYALPANFILTLTKLGGAERKNFSMILEAYAHYHATQPTPAKLVVGGKDCQQLRGLYDIPEEGYGRDILFPGWIGQEDLPAVYSLARVFFYPSNLEAFPIPLTEAMACGVPIITSNVNGLEEIAGEAALYVDPGEADEAGRALGSVLQDEGRAAELSAKALIRSHRFDWGKCARETLDLLESLEDKGLRQGSGRRPVRP